MPLTCQLQTFPELLCTRATLGSSRESLCWGSIDGFLASEAYISVFLEGKRGRMLEDWQVTSQAMQVSMFECDAWKICSLWPNAFHSL